MNLRNPRMIGFGISNKQTFETASAHAAGAIIGSKFVTLLDEEDGDTEKAADKLLEALKNEPFTTRNILFFKNPPERSWRYK